MAKNKKNEDEKKDSSSKLKPVSKKYGDSPKEVMAEKSFIPADLSNSWVGATYHCISVIRVGYKVLNCAHPATYIKFAKDNIAMPLALKYGNNIAQIMTFWTGEAIECAISIPFYATNKVATIYSRTLAEAIKNGLNLEHPEIKATVDVIFTEVAHQTTNHLLKLPQKNPGCSVFFKPTGKAPPIAVNGHHGLYHNMRSKL